MSALHPDTMQTDPAQALEQAIRADGRYPLAAYAFLQRGLEYTCRRVHGEKAGQEPRHVSGQQLCEGLRDLAVETWGPLASMVLRRWHIRRTRDFGEMVYLLIKLALMGRQDADRIEDFDDVYDFEQGFGSYQIPLGQFDEEG